VDRSNRNTALASALVEELARCGVEHACVAPGSRSAPLALALWHEPSIRVFSHVDERCAGFFAIGIAQQTGIPVVVLTTSGTAATNVHPAVAEASEARVPIIIITADRPPELRGRGAGQTIDQLKLYGSSVRWFCELGVNTADDVGLLHCRSTAVRAFAAASGPLPGPVHLNVPLREPLAPLELDSDVQAHDLAAAGRGRAPLTVVHAEPPSPTPELVRALASAITDHPRGVVLAGRQLSAELPAAVAALARAARYPVLAEPTSQLRAGDHDLSHVIAPYDALLREPPVDMQPDLVVRIGDMVTSKATRQWLQANPRCRQIVVDPDEGWNEPTWTAEQIVRVSPSALCQQLAETLEPRLEAEWLDRWLAATKEADGAIDEFLSSLGEELFEPRVYRELSQLLPNDSTVYVSSSMPVRDLETFLRPLERRVRFLANRGANGIDGVVSSGLGAAVTARGRAFILLGDLALYHDMNGLLATRRCGAEATFIVLNNGGGGIFDFLPIADYQSGYEELFATPTGLDLASVAELYQLPYTQIGAYSELAEALSRPGLVEVPLDRDRNVKLHRELFARVADAVTRSPAAS
jgi:2-succinyl-5-enolpyruvyl-6-hydroxy-3-cyclohexene-1-carboxylate synthase